MSALGCFQRNNGKTERAGLRIWLCRLGIAFEAVDLAHQKKNGESDDQKIKHGIYKGADIYGDRARLSGQLKCVIPFTRQGKKAIVQIDGSRQKAKRGHDDVTDQRGNNPAKGGANDDTDG